MRIDNLPPEEMRKIRGKRIGMIFQDPLTSLNPLYRIGDQIVETIRTHLNLSEQAARKRAIDLLAEVGIPAPEKRIDAYPHEFSGGMRQRVVIALAICAEPELIIADEPTTALDVTIQAQVLDVLLEIKDEIDSAIMLITHDLGVVAGMADEVMVMYAGREVERGTVDEIFYSSAHPYTVGLLGSLPRMDDPDAELRPIGGQPPSLINVPSGCPFHPRCPYAQLPDPCSTTAPAPAEVGDGTGRHVSACHYADALSRGTLEVRP
jgi:oligopeptide/dipeptide ABC transporter ATP-binding protein